MTPVEELTERRAKRFVKRKLDNLRGAALILSLLAVLSPGVARANETLFSAEPSQACLEQCQRVWGLSAGLIAARWQAALERALSACAAGPAGQTCRERATRDATSVREAEERDNEHTLGRCLDGCVITVERADRDAQTSPPGTVFCDTGLSCPPATECREYSCSNNGGRQWCLAKARRSGEVCALSDGSQGLCSTGLCIREQEKPNACLAFALRTVFVPAQSAAKSVTRHCAGPSVSRASCESEVRGYQESQLESLLYVLVSCHLNQYFQDDPALPWGTWPTSVNPESTP